MFGKNMKIVTKSFNHWKNYQQKTATECQELNKLNNNDD